MAPVRTGVHAVLALALLALGLTPQAGRAADPFTIDVILPETGAAAFLGKEEGQSLQAIEAATNRAGGIDGRPIHFAIRDDQSQPQVSVEQLNADLAEHPAVILGPSFTSTCSAISPLVAKTGPVVYCFSPGIHPAAGTYMFSGAPSTRSLFQVTERYFHDRGWFKIATITSTDATGQDADNGITAAFGAPGSGETIVTREHFNMSDVSVDAQMARIKNSGAQAVIGWTTGTPFATVLRAASDVGLQVPLLTTAGNLTYAQMKAYAPFMYDRLYFNGYPFVDPAQVADPATRHAVDAFLDAFKAQSVRPDIGQSLAWDPASIVLDAFRHLGLGATATQIRDYIAAIGSTQKFVGIYGPYDFGKRPQRGLDFGNVTVVRWRPKAEAWVAVSRPGGTPFANAAAR